jgi:hypothetical protein
MLEALTNLGDAALVVPVSLALFGYLWAVKSRRAAIAWAAGFWMCIALVFLLKIGFRTCGAQIPELEIGSPSGHTALATTLYGCAALLFGKEYGSRTRMAFALLALVLSGIIGISRVLLHAHTGPEVFGGLLIGLVSIAVFHAGNVGVEQLQLRAGPALALFAALAVTMHGQHLNAEALFAYISREVHDTAGVCLDR